MKTYKMGLFDIFKKKDKKKELNAKIKGIDSYLDDTIEAAPTEKQRKALVALRAALEGVDEQTQEEKEEQIKENRKQWEKEQREKIEKENNKIAKGELWLGMTTQQLVLMKGEPEKKTETISRNKTRNEYYYDGTKNNRGNMSYKLKVVLIEGKVEKWTIT